MNRRRFLRVAGTTGGIAGSLVVGGCLERLGFEEESAWRDPPLVEDRPDAVYVPASTETMGHYGSATDGEYALALSYTIPHRFWTVSGTETNRVTVDTDDTMHLMCTVWDPETDTVLPVELTGEIRRDDDRVGEFSPWPMLSQRMGFHYGDNVRLPDEGSYTVELSVGPVSATPTGEFENRFTAASTLEIDFEYERSDIHDIEFDLVDHDERGTRGALPLMDHGAMDQDQHDQEHDGEDGHDHGGRNDESDLGRPPASRGPPIGELEGRHIGTEESADARISVLETDADRFQSVADVRITGDEDDVEGGENDSVEADGENDSAEDGGETTRSYSYLAVFVRTPHNDVLLPSMSLSVAIERDGTVLLEEPLSQVIDPEFGQHYGITVDGLTSGDQLRISVDSPPQIARHDGYETAFFDFDDVTFGV